MVADVVAPILYGDLVDAADLPGRSRRAMRAFQLDPSTVKVDWALDGPIPWASAAAVRPRHLPRRGLAWSMTEAFSRWRPAPSRPTRSCWPAR